MEENKRATGAPGDPRAARITQENVLRMMMEKKEQAHMHDVTVANIAVNRKHPNELFVRL